MKKIIIISCILTLLIFTLYSILDIKSSDKKNNVNKPIVDKSKVVDQTIPKQSEVGSRMMNIQPQLIGIWRSVDDKESQVQFTDNEKIDVYKDKEIERTPYNMSPLPDDRGWKINVKESDGNYLPYSIVELSDTALIMTYDLRGNTLSYTREKK